MLDDAELFSQLCQKHEILVEPEIIEAVKTSCSTGELRLAHTSIIANLCEVIAQVLSSSSTIKVVDLSDCMLLSKGLTCILKALREGSSVSTLYLKGNNISGPLVEQLGDMLLHNNTIKIMHIEWNSLGSQIDSFSKFCDGLAKNHYIEELDLRYNQISTLCTDSLVTSLKLNKSLKSLDLSWNSLGMTGGQKILQGIKHNRTLVSLNLKGNCIPNDIYSTIKEYVIENQKRKILCEAPVFIKENICPSLNSSDEDEDRNQVKSRLPKKKKKRTKAPLEEIRDSPLGNSGNDEDNAQESKKSILTSKTNASDDAAEFNKKIEGLNHILQERSFTIDLLKTELESKNTELELIKTENEKLKTEVTQLKEEQVKVLEEKIREIENMKKIQTKSENNWKESYKELEETNENNLRLKQEADAKNRAYERELRKATLEIQSIKDKFSSTVQNYEDTISEYKVEIHRAKRELQEKENRCKIETNTLKDTLKETSDALEKCQEQLQKLRNELRESIECQTKLKIKIDECERFAATTTKIQEALQKSKGDKEKLEEKLQESRKSVASLQKEIIKLQEESIEPQKRYEALRIELQLEKEKSSGLKLEIQNERARVKEQNDQLQKMLSQINGLYAQINEAQINHAEALRAKDNEIEKIKTIIAQKSRELEDFKSEQVQRAHQFQVAVTKYLGSFGANSTIS